MPKIIESIMQNNEFIFSYHIQTLLINNKN